MLEVRNISRTYRTGEVAVQALQDVSLRIEQGEFVAIVGPSGSGKSTLLHVLGLLDRPDAGSYEFLGSDVTGLPDDRLAALRNSLVGFVFQQFHLLPRSTAAANVALPLIYGGRGDRRETAARRLREVGLEHRMHHRPNELSGGEQQRVAVARALVNDPLVVLADEPTGNLDSKSGAEIVALLEALHRRGTTLVIVTHEREIARRADRVVEMSDGRILADHRAERHGGAPAGRSELDELLRRRLVRLSGARALDHWRQALRSIGSHKMRSALSMFGVLVGVAAVVAMVAIGQGASSSIRERLSSLGSNLLEVMPHARRMQGVALEAGLVTRFTLEDARLMAALPAVRRTDAGVSRRCQIVYENHNWNTQVEGRTAQYPFMHNSVPAVGRFYTEDEVRKREKVAVLGTTVARELFGTSNPVGRTVKINRLYFQIIGVLPARGGSGWHDWDDRIIIPISTALFRVFGERYVRRIEVEVRDASLIEQAKREINEFMIRRHNWPADAEHEVEIRDMTELQEVLTGTTRSMSSLLASIAAVSLLVGGIGIMNIMLVSVTERTREIGLRKALGARGRDIMAQFLVEAVAMTLLGGLMGIALGAGIALILARLAEWPVQLSPLAVVVATTFSIGVGLLFGLWPARQAARLDPITALRYE